MEEGRGKVGSSGFGAGGFGAIEANRGVTIAVGSAGGFGAIEAKLRRPESEPAARACAGVAGTWFDE